MAAFNPHLENVKSDIRKALMNSKANSCPMGIRIAWHASGTFDPVSKTGGSDGATMRFAPEYSDDANAGLPIMMDILKPVKKAHPEVSMADIWALAGASACEFLGGPKVPFAFGRTDSDGKVVSDGKDSPGCPNMCVVANGRLPDAMQGAEHLRDVFGKRMGFSDREIVALSGAHTLGSCHKVRSGFDGPWTDHPLKFDNMYFKNLMDLEWQLRDWDGKTQYEDTKTKRLMMLETDMALKSDPVFNPIAREYADNEAVFFKDFAAVMSKLIHLGCKNQPVTTVAAKTPSQEFREYAMHGSTLRMKAFAAQADCNEQELDSGRTALHKACFWGHIETITYILDECKGINCNIQDFNGDTCLHDAARFGHGALVAKLLSSKADKTIKNKAGQTAMDVAKDFDKFEVAMQLR